MSINRTKIKRQLYAKGGLGQLVGREKFGVGSKFKKVLKKVTQPVVKVAQKLVPKEIAGPLMMAAPFLGPVYGPIAYAAGSAKKTGRIDPIKLALVSAPYVKFQGGQGIGAFKPVGYGGSKYGIFGGDEVMYDFPSFTKTTPEVFVPSGEIGIGDYVDTGLTPESYAKAQTVTDPGVIVPQASTPTSGPVSIADVAGKYFKEPLSILKTKESPEGRSIQEVLMGAATSPQGIVSTGVGVTQYIMAKKQEIEDAGGTFDREAYDNALNEYYTKYASSFQRGFSKKGGLSQLSPRTKFKGGLSASRVTQLLQLKEEAIQQGNDDKVIEIDQELYALTGKVFESNGGRIGFERGGVSYSKSIMEEFRRNKIAGYPGTIEDYITEFYGEEYLDPAAMAKGGIIKLRKKLEDSFKATDLLDSEYFDQKADDKERVINDLLDQGYDYEEVMKLVSPESIYRDDQGMPQTFGGEQPMITFDIETIGKKDGGRIRYMGGGNIKSVPIRNNQFGVKELDYRAGGGFVPVGVKERADDVPAMLSKNEFVMTADAVRGAGNGDINKGARKMYNLMKNLETRRV